MLLTWDDSELFFRLHRALMHFVNLRLGIVPDISSPEEFSGLPPEQRHSVWQALLEDVDLIELFVDENPEHLSEEELDIVLSWRHHVSGTFYIFRQLKNYMVFLNAEEPPVAYGVIALTEPFEDLIGPYLPRMTETVLLPFKGRIVYDGMLNGYNISFGGGIKQMLNDSYRQAKARLGIVTSLPIEGDARTTTLDDLELTLHRTFGYWFDFGDDWYHQVQVERIDRAIPTVNYPRVIRRVGKSPPQYSVAE